MRDMVKVRFVSPISADTDYVAISEQEYKRLYLSQLKFEAIGPFKDSDYYLNRYKEYILEDRIPEHALVDSSTFSSWINAMKTNPEELDEDVYQRLTLEDLVDYEVDIMDNF